MSRPMFPSSFLLFSASDSQSLSPPTPQVFKATFMLLFVAYPGTALKLIRIFRCVEYEGHHWLAADMRLECYTSQWAGYAHEVD